jgi:diguanylate cyclase (GGDEF)-like protein
MVEEKNKDNTENEFFARPEIIENHFLLRDIGVFRYIDSLSKEIRNYKSLLTRGLDIFNRTSIEEIMDATVWQISDQFLPSLIAFLWKPNQNKEAVTVKAYRNYAPVDLDFFVDNITPFDSFFRKYPAPISFDLLAFQLENNEAIASLEPIKPEIIIPILGQMGLYGIIAVGSKTLEKGYTQEELLFLQQLMSFVSQAIKNHLHYEQSVRDVKTGLYNHGFFMSRLSEEIARSKRTNYISSIIVIDVDKFKNFNDTYGHLAGDQVLEYIALAIKQAVRIDDVPSRFGGEEFTVLLPNTDISNALTIAERLRKKISEMHVPWKTPLPQVTISLGICTFENSSNTDALEVIRRADEALYISKEQGRNRTTLWGSGLMFKMIKKGFV